MPLGIGPVTSTAVPPIGPAPQPARAGHRDPGDPGASGRVAAAPTTGPRVSIEIGRIEIRASARPSPLPMPTGIAPREHVIDPQLPVGGRRRGP